MGKCQLDYMLSFACIILINFSMIFNLTLYLGNLHNLPSILLSPFGNLDHLLYQAKIFHLLKAPTILSVSYVLKFQKNDRQEYAVSEGPQTEERIGAVKLLMDNVYTRIVDKVIKFMKEKEKPYIASAGTQLHNFTSGQPLPLSSSQESIDCFQHR